MFSCCLNVLVNEIWASDDSLVMVATLLFLSFSSSLKFFLVKNQYPAQEALLQALKLALKPAWEILVTLVVASLDALPLNY